MKKNDNSEVGDILPVSEAYYKYLAYAILTVGGWWWCGWTLNILTVVWTLAMLFWVMIPYEAIDRFDFLLAWMEKYAWHRRNVYERLLKWRTHLSLAYFLLTVVWAVAFAVMKENGWQICGWLAAMLVSTGVICWQQRKAEKFFNRLFQ